MSRFVFLVVFSCILFATHAQQGLEKLPETGTNPGNLEGYIHLSKKKGLSIKMPLVVALHGCSQSPGSLAHDAGWNELGDRYGFHVLYPAQRLVNNMSSCFNWFKTGDFSKNSGEALSIEEQVRYAINTYHIDTTRIFVYGVSAGAAMSMALLADYPALFHSGAIVAGGPFGAATSSGEGLNMMMQGVHKTPEEWKHLVTAQNPDYKGAYPRLIVMHGTDDKVVDVRNAAEIVSQWTAVLNTDSQADETINAFGGAAIVTRFRYNAADGTAAVVYYELKGIGHVLSIDPGTGPHQGGKTGRFTTDRDFYSTYWIAVDFGLIEGSSN